MHKSIIIFLNLCILNSVWGQTYSTSVAIPKEWFSELTFRSPGPSRGGRVTAVEGVVSKPGTFYMGASGGGVWKTDDYGVSWKNISDGFFESPSIGDIDVFQSNPDVIYVGTGSDAIRSNVISGKGVYKSANGGKTWNHVGLEKAGQIGAVAIDPGNPSVVFVAAIGQAFQPNEERGVYRTTDGGDHWERVLFHSDTVGAVDVVFAPGESKIIYAALWRAERKPWTIISGCHSCGGIYKSTDAGSTWQQTTAGLPSGLIGKIDLTVSPANPAYVYALVEAPAGQGGLYRSKDYGNSFEFIQNNMTSELISRPFYYCNIEANPRNAETIFAMSENLLLSNNGGKSWSKISTPHGDHHKIWINPKDTLVFIEANDGGVNITTNGGKTWSSQYNQPTAELYQVEVDDQYPYWIYAGQQDELTIAVPSLPPYRLVGDMTGYWRLAGGCETGPAVPKPGDPDIVYANCKGRFGIYNMATGQEKQYYVGASNMYGHNPKDLKYRFQRVSPIHISPHNPNVIYHASQYLHKTTDEGISWEKISPDLTAFKPETQVISGSPITRDITGEEFYSTIYSVRESVKKEGLIWVGANDGPIHLTSNGGKHWKEVTPRDYPEGGRVNCVEPSSHQVNKAYTAVLRYQLGDWKPYIFRTTNLGKQWKLLTTGRNGIPDNYPVRVVREDPELEGLLYAGTEYGLFISFDNGEHWQSFQQNLPIVPITDIKIFRDDLILSTMGRSFWIMDNIGRLRQLKTFKNDNSFLFKPRDTYRYRFASTPVNSVPTYPSPGVLIDYYIHPEFKGRVTIQILDSKKNIVREYDGLNNLDSLQQLSSNDTLNLGKAVLNVSAGMHRFNWDLRHAGAWDKKLNDRYKNGPYAAPGKYVARLVLGNKTYEQTFSLLKDPRVNVNDADLAEQENLALAVRDLLDSARRIAFNLESQKKELEQSGSENSKLVLDRMKLLLEKLVSAEGPYPTPMLLDQLGYLQSMLNRADQKPGTDAIDRFRELRQIFYVLRSEYRSLTQTLPQFRK